MSDLISRQAAINAFKKELTVGESKGNYVTICSAVGYEGAKQILESLPSADTDLSGFSDKLWAAAYERGKAEAVRHGRWIDTETSYADCVQQKCQCSVCKRLSPRPLGDFCRWCGTDMRGDT